MGNGYGSTLVDLTHSLIDMDDIAYVGHASEKAEGRPGDDYGGVVLFKSGRSLALEAVDLARVMLAMRATRRTFGPHHLPSDPAPPANPNDPRGCTLDEP